MLMAGKVSNFQHYSLNSHLLMRNALCEMQMRTLIECTLIFGLDEFHYKDFDVLHRQLKVHYFGI